ncbi:MAG: hypothetical protein AB1801_13440 [Chloroflexota bacterium]
MNENNAGEKYYDLSLLVVLAILAGGGTTTEWKISDLSTIFPFPSAGSILMGVIGVLSVVYLLVAYRRSLRWRIVIVGFLIDFLLTAILTWPVRELVIADPLLGLWPYVLGTLATFLAAIAVGFMMPKAPLPHAFGFVSIDLVFTGITGFFLPQALTWALISRIFVAYSAAGMGALIGKYAHFVMKEDRNALGKFLGTFLVECTTAIIAGIVAVIILEHLS